MTDEQIALARRAVACKGWRWMPGMRVVGIPSRMLLEDEDGCGRWIDSTPTDCLMTQGIPDLTDPATLGCLLALVREAHGAPFLQVSVSISREHGYRFECSPRHRGAWVESEEEALVAALEAAQ